MSSSQAPDKERDKAGDGRYARPSGSSSGRCGTRWRGDGRVPPATGSSQSADKEGNKTDGAPYARCSDSCWGRSRTSSHDADSVRGLPPMSSAQAADKAVPYARPSDLSWGRSRTIPLDYGLKRPRFSGSLLQPTPPQRELDVAGACSGDALLPGKVHNCPADPRAGGDPHPVGVVHGCPDRDVVFGDLGDVTIGDSDRVLELDNLDDVIIDHRIELLREILDQGDLDDVNTRGQLTMMLDRLRHQGLLNHAETRWQIETLLQQKRVQRKLPGNLEPQCDLGVAGASAGVNLHSVEDAGVLVAAGGFRVDSQQEDDDDDDDDGVLVAGGHFRVDSELDGDDDDDDGVMFARGSFRGDSKQDDDDDDDDDGVMFADGGFRVDSQHHDDDDDDDDDDGGGGVVLVAGRRSRDDSQHDDDDDDDGGGGGVVLVAGRRSRDDSQLYGDGVLDRVRGLKMLGQRYIHDADRRKQINMLLHQLHGQGLPHNTHSKQEIVTMLNSASAFVEIDQELKEIISDQSVLQHADVSQTMKRKFGRQVNLDPKDPGVNAELASPQVSCTLGIHNNDLTSMIILILIFNALMPFLPLVDLDDHTYVVWQMSLYICAQFFLMILPLRTTAGIIDTFSCIFFGPLLGFAITNLVSPLIGVAIAYLSVARASGLFGYTVAQYRLRAGTANAAATVNPSYVSKEERRQQRIYTQINSVFYLTSMILCLSALMLLVMSVPEDVDIYYVVWGLSILLWWIMCFALVTLSAFMSHGLLVTERMVAYHIASFPVSFPCIFISLLLWTLFSVLQMILLAVYFGYMLAVNARYKELVPKDGEDAANLEDITSDIAEMPKGDSTVMARELIKQSGPKAAAVRKLTPDVVKSSPENAAARPLTTDIYWNCPRGLMDGPAIREKITPDASPNMVTS